MKNKHIKRRPIRIFALLLCLCLICLPLMGMAATASGETEPEDSGESEVVVIDIVPDESETESDDSETDPSGSDGSDTPDEPATPEEPETPETPDEPEVPTEPETPDEPVPTEPVCICETKCSAEAPNPDCPVCSVGVEGCMGEELVPDFTIYILRPDGWFTETASVSIRVIDVNKTDWEKVEVKIEKNGSWVDVTDTLIETDTTTIEITENCSIYVTVTDKDGKTHTKNAYIECFDRDEPSIRAGIDGDLLRVEASDALSGVEYIYVNGYRFTTFVNGTLDIRLKDYADEYEQMSVVAVDYAGNKSNTVQVKNPYYDDDDDCPTTTTTPTVTQAPTVTPVTTPTVSNAGSSGTSGTTLSATTAPTESDTETEVTIEPGDGFTENGNAVTRDLLYDRYTNKQFIAVQTKDGDTFYIIIDYDKPLDEEGESYETYFLNLVDDADLMALVDDGTDEEVEVCTCTDKCVAGNVNTSCPVCAHNMSECVGEEAEIEPDEPVVEPEPEAESSSPVGAVAIVLVIVAIGGVAVWYFKFRKPKNSGKGKNDMDDYGFDDDEDEEEIYENEDHALPEHEVVSEGAESEDE